MLFRTDVRIPLRGIPGPPEEQTRQSSGGLNPDRTVQRVLRKISGWSIPHEPLWFRYNSVSFVTIFSAFLTDDFADTAHRDTKCLCQRLIRFAIIASPEDLVRVRVTDILNHPLPAFA